MTPECVPMHMVVSEQSAMGPICSEPGASPSCTLPGPTETLPILINCVLSISDCSQDRSRAPGHAQVDARQVLRQPPLPLATLSLQKEAITHLRMPGERMMKLAEELYQEGFISYPRTETDCFDPAYDLKVPSPPHSFHSSFVGSHRKPKRCDDLQSTGGSRDLYLQDYHISCHVLLRECLVMGV